MCINTIFINQITYHSLYKKQTLLLSINMSKHALLLILYVLMQNTLIRLKNKHLLIASTGIMRTRMLVTNLVKK